MILNVFLLMAKFKIKKAKRIEEQRSLAYDQMIYQSAFLAYLE